MDRYQCRCQYVYDPAIGDPTQGIPPGTPFTELPDSWVCPQCGLAKSYFVKAVGKPTSEQGHPTIKVMVKCFTTLIKADTCDYKGSTEHEISEGSTIHDLIEKLGLPLDAIKIIFVNSKDADFDTVLKAGDQVAFSPKTGAM
jgi:rubredoxin/molybdopterin converting factor small subunit